MKKQARDKLMAIWIDDESAIKIDMYRATQMPVPTKQDALRDLIRIGWEIAVEKKKKVKNGK